MRKDVRFQAVSDVQAQYGPQIMSLPHVVGIGIGYRKRQNRATDELALVVMVDQKVPETLLAQNDIVPKTLDGVPVDVQETGSFHV
jgi:hypothetical protein